MVASKRIIILFCFGWSHSFTQHFLSDFVAFFFARVVVTEFHFRPKFFVIANSSFVFCFVSVRIFCWIFVASRQSPSPRTTSVRVAIRGYFYPLFSCTKFCLIIIFRCLHVICCCSDGSLFHSFAFAHCVNGFILMYNVAWRSYVMRLEFIISVVSFPLNGVEVEISNGQRAESFMIHRRVGQIRWIRADAVC